jgi:hypothetical protein
MVSILNRRVKMNLLRGFFLFLLVGLIACSGHGPGGACIENMPGMIMCNSPNNILTPVPNVIDTTGTDIKCPFEIPVAFKDDTVIRLTVNTLVTNCTDPR